VIEPVIQSPSQCALPLWADRNRRRAGLNLRPVKARLEYSTKNLTTNHTNSIRQSVFMYIEAYYNRIRIQRTFSPAALDYLAPDMFYWGQAV
jgi:hypothetical protein